MAARLAPLPRAVRFANESTTDDDDDDPRPQSKTRRSGPRKSSPAYVVHHAGGHPENPFRKSAVKHQAYELYINGTPHHEFVAAVTALGAKSISAMSWWSSFGKMVAAHRSGKQQS